MTTPSLTVIRSPFLQTDQLRRRVNVSFFLTDAYRRYVLSIGAIDTARGYHQLPQQQKTRKDAGMTVHSEENNSGSTGSAVYV